MYKSFHIKNFRGFGDLKLDHLARINLIAGKNNVGKTALLEALWIFAGKYNPILAIRVNAFRGLEEYRIEFNPWAETPWDTLFREFDTSETIELSSQNSKSKRRFIRLKALYDPKQLAELAIIQRGRSEPSGASSSVEKAHVLSLEYQEGATGKIEQYYLIVEPGGGIQEPIVPSPPFQSVFMPARHRMKPEETARRFSNLDIAGKLEILRNSLKIVEPELGRLTLGYGTSKDPIIYGEIPGRRKLVPIALMGDGISRLADLILAMGYAQDGIVLVDEIENGLHYSVLKDVWSAINQAALAFNTQVFATTHSFECVRAAHEAFSESDKYDFKYLRLDRTKAGDIRVVDYDEETMQTAIESGYEVR